MADHTELASRGISAHFPRIIIFKRLLKIMILGNDNILSSNRSLFTKKADRAGSH